MVDTQRTNYWQSIVDTPTGVVAGTYEFGNGSITVDESGRITAATDSLGSINAAVVADPAELAALVSSSTAGRLVTVIDAGNGYTALYYFNGTSFVRIGNNPAFSVRYVRASFGTASSNNIGSPLPTNAVIRSVRLQILTPYSTGTQIRVIGESGTIYMETFQNDPEVANIYVAEPGGNTAVGTPNDQLQVEVINAPGAGSAMVTVEYYLP